MFGPLAVVLVVCCEMSTGISQFPNLPEPAHSLVKKLHFSSTQKTGRSLEQLLGRGSSSDKQILSPDTDETCPKGFIKAGVNCLWVNKNPLPWISARNICTQYGLSLLEVRSGNYYVDVIKSIRKHNKGKGSYWIGASNRTGSWRWNSIHTRRNGSFWAVTFINDKNQNKFEEKEEDDKHCAFMDDSRWYFLNADHCDASKPFICENIPFDKPIVKEPLCEKEWSIYEKNCYRLIEEKASYFDAREICERRNATLVSINDTAENDWVAGLATSVTIFWIGLQRNEDKEFEWTDGSQLKYSNWQKKEPNNFRNAENCVNLDKTSKNQWRDKFCGNVHRFVCEKEALV